MAHSTLEENTFNFKKDSKISKTKKELHLARKIWHIGGVLSILYFYQSLPYRQMVYFGALIVLILVLIDFTRLQIPSLNRAVQFFMKPFIRVEEKTQLSGLSYMVVGTYLTALFFPKEVVILSYIFLALGDPVASFFGVLYGQNKIGSKSIEGTLSCFIVCTVIAATYFGLNNFFGHRIFITVPLAGLIGCLAELVQIKNFDDNMTLPLFSGFGLWGLFYIFSITL